MENQTTNVSFSKFQGCENIKSDFFSFEFVLLGYKNDLSINVFHDKLEAVDSPCFSMKNFKQFQIN